MNGWIITLCLIWGSNWIAMKAATGFFPPLTFSALRFLIGSVVLVLIIFYRRIPLPTKRDLKWYAICGLLQTTFIYAVNQPAMEYVQAGVVCILGFTMPFWLCLLGHFFIPGERITLNKALGVIIGIIGLVFVMNINPANFHWSKMEIIFELLNIIGAVAWAVANIIIKTKLQNNDKFQFTAYQMIIGTVGLLILSFALEGGQKVTWNATSITSVLFSGVVASSLAYVLWFYILSKVDASKASITLLLVPVVGVLSMWLFLDERLDFHTLSGMILVVTGIALVNKKQTLRVENQVGKHVG